MNILRTAFTAVIAITLFAAPAASAQTAPVAIHVQVNGTQRVAIPDPAVLDASVDDALNRAAQYWGAAPGCNDGVQVVYDDAMTGASGAAAVTPGCTIYIGDYFMGRFTQLERCRDLVHEWGHLLGHLHVPSGDPDNVMPYQTDPATGWLYINTASTCDPAAAITADAPTMIAQAADQHTTPLAHTHAEIASPGVTPPATPPAKGGRQVLLDGSYMAWNTRSYFTRARRLARLLRAHHH